MPFNYAAQQLRAGQMIARYGRQKSTESARLRKPGAADVPVTAVEIMFSPNSPRKLADPAVRRFLISALDFSGEITQQHSLVISEFGKDKVLRQTGQDPGRLAPAGIVIFWDLLVKG